jgi:hypothetical protein
MSEPLVFIDISEILEGKIEDLKAAIEDLAAFVEDNEPRAVAYSFYFDEDATTMTVVQVHPDSASMEFHMTAAADIFPRFVGLVRMLTMDIYGTPSDELLDLTRKKAQMLGASALRVHELQAGFARWESLSAGR